MIYNSNFFADTQAASETLKSSIAPLFSTMVTVAAILCILFVVFGGYYYMTSAGKPEKLERAKKTLRNAFIGLVVVLGAGTLVTIIQNAYTQKAVEPTSIAQVQVQQTKNDCPLCEVVNQSISGFINGVLQSIGKPVIEILKQFTTATPLMAQNNSVFNLWVVIVAMVDVLFLLVIGLIGFRIMSASVIGFEEVDLRSLIPQIVLTFILSNLSIFAIDAIISVSNAMIQALLLGMSNDIIWTTLGGLISGAAAMNIGVLLFVAVAIVLAVLLLIYYLKRMIILYIGTVLSPLIVLLWLLPSFRDFAVSSAKMYISTIFVLFVQVVVLMLAVSLFSGLVKGDGNSFMTALLAIATLSVLLSTNRTMNQLTMMSAGGQGMRRLGNTFVRGATYIANATKPVLPPKYTVNNIYRNSGAGMTLNQWRASMPASTLSATQESYRASPQQAATVSVERWSAPKKDIVSSGASGTSTTVRKKPRASKGEKS